jgi:hypothetical protein
MNLKKSKKKIETIPFSPKWLTKKLFKAQLKENNLFKRLIKFDFGYTYEPQKKPK